MSVPVPSNPSLSSPSVSAATDGYASENERSRSPFPIIHRITNSPVLPTASSPPLFTCEPSILDTGNLLMPRTPQQAHASLAGVRGNERAFSLLLEDGNLVDVHEFDESDTEMPVADTALIPFDAADPGEGSSGASSQAGNMQQGGRLALQLDFPLLTNLLVEPEPQVTPFLSSFESASAAALVSASRFRLTLNKMKTVKLEFKEVLKKDERLYFVFDLPKGALPCPFILGVRLLLLKTGNPQPFTETTTVYKRCRQLIVLVPEIKCSISKSCIFNILCFSYAQEKIINPCYTLRSTFSLAHKNITCVLWDPVPPSRGKNDAGKIKSVLA